MPVYCLYLFFSALAITPLLKALYPRDEHLHVEQEKGSLPYTCVVLQLETVIHGGFAMKRTLKNVGCFIMILMKQPTFAFEPIHRSYPDFSVSPTEHLLSQIDLFLRS
jgi:hypothetical protein